MEPPSGAKAHAHFAALAARDPEGTPSCPDTCKGTAWLDNFLPLSPSFSAAWGGVGGGYIGEMSQSKPEWRAELRALVVLAVPVVLSELGWMAQGVVDTIMVGRLGPAAIGAVALGNAICYTPSLFGVGLMLGL